MPNQNNKTDKPNNNLSSEEKRRMHDAYSSMGKKGGSIGGRARAEQMAKEGFKEKK